MDVDKLLRLDSYVSLSSLKIGTVAEAYKMEIKEIGETRVGLLSVVMRTGKSMTKTKLMIPLRIAERLTNQLPGVVVYCGLGQSEGTTNQWHDLQLMSPSTEGMSVLDHANQLRQLSTPDLISRAKVDTLSKFAAGTVFTCWNLEMRRMSSGDSIAIVSYDTFITNAEGAPENKRGRLFVPPRYTDEVQAAECCIMVYKGLKKSKLGRDYHNLNITTMPRFILPTQTDEELASALFDIPKSLDTSASF